MEIIGDILSILAGTLLFKLTEIFAERNKREILTFFIFVTWLIFIAVIFFLVALFEIIGIKSSASLTALAVTVLAGMLICRLLLKIIKWLKTARNEA